MSEFSKRLEVGWGEFSGSVVKFGEKHPKGVPIEYVMHPYGVKLQYRHHPWCTVRFEVSYDEIGDADEPEDAIELMLAGASAVAVGTAAFTDPSTAARVCDGIAAYCERHGFASARDIVGLCT